MNRRAFIALAGGAAAAWPLSARAQQAATPVIGFLLLQPPALDIAFRATKESAFNKGLDKSGYQGGHHVKIEYRSANGHAGRLPELADDFVKQQVSAIVVTNTIGALAAKAATSSIPIVFGLGLDPVSTGLVASNRRPGSNLTGVFQFAGILGPKQLDIMRQLAPNGSLIGFLVSRNTVNVEFEVDQMQRAARAVGQQLLVLKAGSENEIEAAFAQMVQHRVGALLLGANFASQYAQLIALTAHNAIPTIYESSDIARAGGLMSYGHSLSDEYLKIGFDVGRILQGEKPADIPVEQVTEFELVINLKTAKALGLTVPPSLLAQADEVIE